MASEFLKGLPVHNKENFSQFQVDAQGKNSQTTVPPYIPIEDNNESVEIVSDKTNILLRYLHQQCEKKSIRKRKSQFHQTDEELTKSKRTRYDRDMSPDSS